MEELGNRDQELNDLVMSHQKQVKAWESDTKKLATVQARLSQYEGRPQLREAGSYIITFQQVLASIYKGTISAI